LLLNDESLLNLITAAAAAAAAATFGRTEIYFARFAGESWIAKTNERRLQSNANAITAAWIREAQINLQIAHERTG